MNEAVFKNIFEEADGSSLITMKDFLICIGVALVLGLVMAIVYTIKARYTKSFVVTLAMMPAIVCVVIMMVSGSLGAGIAVAGTFSLVRFRSAQGTAKEIGAIFLAMAVGIACGMGYPVFAGTFALIMCVVNILYTVTKFGENNYSELKKTVSITVPEDLDYTEIFDEVFEKYTSEVCLKRVKTTNLGSLNRLTYDVTMKETGMEKAMIDDLRVRNGNLEISISLQATEVCEL